MVETANKIAVDAGTVWWIEMQRLELSTDKTRCWMCANSIAAFAKTGACGFGVRDGEPASAIFEHALSQSESINKMRRTDNARLILLYW